MSRLLFTSSNDPLQNGNAWKSFVYRNAGKIPQHKINTSDVFIQQTNPHLIYDSKWKIPVKSLFRMENMQNYANAILVVVRDGVEGKSNRFFSPIAKKWNRKIMRNFFHFFFSLFRDLGRSNLINSRNKWNFRLSLIYIFQSPFSILFVQLVSSWKNCDICGLGNCLNDMKDF